MKRRDFIKVSSAAGIGGMVVPGYSSMAGPNSSGSGRFDLHPFIKKHPEAVFVNLTSVKEETDSKAIFDVAAKLSDEMFVKAKNGKGYSNSTKITCKPNWTGGGGRGDSLDHLGMTTDLNYIEGFLSTVKKKGPEDCYLRECSGPNF
jgi:hypothetical protein